MKTHAQKTDIIKQNSKILERYENIVFVDFSKVSVKSVAVFKKKLKQAGAMFVVTKKRLFAIAFRENGHEFDPTQFNAQLGLVCIPGELSSTAGIVYKFSRELAKEKQIFTVLGAYNVFEKQFFTADEFLKIAKLPSREVLLAMVVGMLAAPIRGFMHIVDELSNRQPEEVVAEVKKVGA